MKKLTKNYTEACGNLKDKTFYLYDPFEASIYEVYIKDIMENMFGEPDEIYCSLRMYANEKGINLNIGSWEDTGSVATFPYLGHSFVEKEKAITEFQADLVLKKSRLEEEIRSIQRTIQMLNEEKKATIS
jgi:hypothetical protein